MSDIPPIIPKFIDGTDWNIHLALHLSNHLGRMP